MKSFARLARFLVAGLAFAFIRIGSAEIVENASFSGPKTTIRYSLWGGADEVSSAKQICRAFVEQNPDIRIDVSIYPWGQYWAKVQTQMASGLAPDVLSFYSGSFGVWVSRGALLPLDDLIKATKTDMGGFYPVAIQNCSWNGKLYTMPMEIPVWSVVFSTDRLEESGIPQSQWPKSDKAMSWTEFEALARRLTLRNADGSFAQYGMSAGQNWDDIISGMYGGELVDRQVNPTRSTVAGNELLIRALIQLFQAQYGDRTTLGAVPLASGAFAASTDTLLTDSKFAMGTTGPWALKQLQDAGVKFGVTPVPVGTRPHSLINVNSAGIFVHSRHPLEAWRFVRFMASEPNERLYGSQLKGVPALRSARDSLIHNAFGIHGCEAFLHDLEVAEPAITSDVTDVTGNRDKWRNSIELQLENEYDARLAALPRVHGRISGADYQRFVAGMNGYIEKTVRGRIPELDASITEAFSEARLGPPSFFVRNVAPILAGIFLVIGLLVYIRAVASSRTPSEVEKSPARKAGAIGYLFLAPWLFGLTFFVIGPILAAIFLSFTNWNMISPPTWIGFQYYMHMPADPKFLIGLKNTFMYVLFVIPISLFGGLFTAGLLSSGVRGADLFKAIIYFPALFTGAEAAVLWVNMLNKDHGVFNYFLSWLHIAPIDWMDEGHAFYSVVLMNVFWIGGAMIIYYAGMKQIPNTLYEAADIDGASAARKFMRITIPLLSPVILFMVVMTTIGAFQVFTPALFFADSSTDIGQPGDSLRFYSVNIYDQAFNNLHMGLACSYAIILFLIIFAITFVQLKVANRFVYTETVS